VRRAVCWPMGVAVGALSARLGALAGIPAPERVLNVLAARGVDFSVTDRSGLPASVSERTPVRMCVGCRRRDSWSALLRVVAVKDEQNGSVRLAPDPQHRLPGRGAWLHPSTTCLEQAVRRKAFTRALRLGAGPDVAPVVEYLHQISTQPKAGHAE
jgi:uncharacterized protein